MLLPSHVDCMTSQPTDLILNESFFIQIHQTNLMHRAIFNPLLCAQLQELAGGCPCKSGSLRGCEKKQLFFFFFQTQQSRTTTRKKTFCIFVIPEDNVSFLSWLCFSSLSPGVSGVLWKRYPSFSSSSWVTWEECARRSVVWRRWGTWGSEEEHWSLTGPKLSVRLEHETWDSTGGCTSKAAANCSDKIPKTYSALNITLFEIPLVT